jgi:hypothetical protein
MRLVDIDDVRDGIKDSLGINIMLVYSGDKWEDILDSIPTAYDVDEVVEQITELGKRFCDSVGCEKDCINCEHWAMMRGVIEIVKRGGIEDVKTKS